MNVSELISSLAQYGLDCGLIEPCDINFITNQLLQALGLDSFEPAAPVSLPLEEILKRLVDDAVRRGICGEDICSGSKVGKGEEKECFSVAPDNPAYSGKL